MRDFIVGIDIGSAMTRVVVAMPAHTNEPPTVIAIGSTETEGIKRGYVVDGEKVTQSIRKAVMRAEKIIDTKIKRAYIAVSGQSLESHTFDASITVSKGDGQVTQFDIDALEQKIEQQFHQQKKNRKILHLISLRYTIDGEDTMGNPLGRYGNKIEARYMIISLYEHHVDDMVKSITRAGIDITDIIASPLALSLAVINPRQRMMGVGILDIGSEISTLSLFENDRVIGVATFPFGSLDITSDIALGLKISLDEAHELKETYTKGTPQTKKRVAQIVSARLADIFEMTQKYLVLHRRNNLLPAGIIITGGGSLLHDVASYSNKILDLPVSLADPYTRFGKATKMLPDIRWLTAYSLCFLDRNAETEFSTDFFHMWSQGVKKWFHRALEHFMP